MLAIQVTQTRIDGCARRGNHERPVITPKTLPYQNQKARVLLGFAPQLKAVTENIEGCLKMRNAALILGLIGGLWGMLVGFFSFGYTDLLIRYPELADITGGVVNMSLIRVTSLLAPILAIAGAAMARSVHVAAGILLLTASAGMYLTFGFGVFTMFPIAMCAVAGALALGARQPDPH